MATDNAEENYIKYAIIGAGISGLSAASHFVKNDVRNFKVFEARNRLGGRILTIQIGASKVELGANWIHGILGNPLYELATSHGLLGNDAAPKPHNVAATTEDGRRLPFSILQETYEAYFWFFKRCEEYFLCKYKPPEGIHSVGEHVELEISIYLQKYPPQQRHLRRLVFNYLLNRECCITGCDSMKDVDLMGIGSYTELPGGNIILPHGYSSLLSPILQSIPEDKIQKSFPVKIIHWNIGEEDYESDNSDESVKTIREACYSTTSSSFSSRCPSPKFENENGIRTPNVKIEFENGTFILCDYVICTIPLGVLKSSPNLFNPPLPPDKVEAFHKMNFGTVNKIYLEYDTPFLSPEISEVILLWNLLPNESSIPIHDKWFRKIYSFCKASETLLVGWISGDAAKYMETLKMNVIAETCNNILKKFLADPFIPKPKSCIFTAWSSQPYSQGSYSSIGIGGNQSHIEKIAEPLYKTLDHKKVPVVSFAGEHCHPAFYSTGHGAYLSGRSVAQSLIKASRSSEEDVINLSNTSIADLSTWLEEVSLGQKNLEDYKHRPSRDNRQIVTPR